MAVPSLDGTAEGTARYSAGWTTAVPRNGASSPTLLTHSTTNTRRREKRVHTCAAALAMIAAHSATRVCQVDMRDCVSCETWEILSRRCETWEDFFSTF